MKDMKKTGFFFFGKLCEMRPQRRNASTSHSARHLAMVSKKEEPQVFFMSFMLKAF